MAARKGANGSSKASAASYRHTSAESLLRPDVGTQAQFRKRKPAATYRYDSSLSPVLEWDAANPARETGEWLLRQIEEAAALPAPHRFDAPREFRSGGSAGPPALVVAGLHDAVAELRKLSRPFLNWTGKAERPALEVPTLPLFVHERLSTQAILETLKGHKRDRQLDMFSLFADPELPIHQQVLRSYEHPGGWTNRMVLGDSLVVMNSLLRYEGLGGQVQTIYMDPPYGVKFGSNFQPFVRRRDVKHNDDEDMTREPEMVKAYRDTWELGLHSYLTYLRERLLVARELLAPSGSVFVQISDENVHHVREVMDEVLGQGNFVALITFAKTTGSTSDHLAGACDYLVWYGRDVERLKYRSVFSSKSLGGPGASGYSRLLLSDGSRRTLLPEETQGRTSLPLGARVYTLDNLMSQSIGRDKGEGAACWFPVEINGRKYLPNARSRWKTNENGMRSLLAARRLEPAGDTLRYVRYLDDFPAFPVNNVWDDTGIAGFAADKLYVVQTATKVAERCILMTTDPGDLVLDPTCGSGTTAYVAEQWGRRWITIDTSRVPLALARQRLLTATYPWYRLKSDGRGPASGFEYRRRQNARGEEVGGIVPHVTLGSIANDEPPAEEVLVDRPERDEKLVRVTGPFCVEGTIPTPTDAEGEAPPTVAGDASFEQRMLEVLRRSPVLHVGGGKTVQFASVRAPARTLHLSAEAVVAGGGARTAAPAGTAPEPADAQAPVAILFGPENGALGERAVWEAAKEAEARGYRHLYVIGFAIHPNARKYVESCEEIHPGLPATYVQATPDLLMGDLLRNLRSSQIFSVCGLPDVRLRKLARAERGAAARYEVTLLGLDVFDPVEMKTDSRRGDDVPAWFLDTDYNGLCFHVCQAFFPRTAAWDDLKRSLKGEYEDSVWEHLRGATSAPFEAGGHGQVAVKVVDDRGNELMVVRGVKEAES